MFKFFPKTFKLEKIKALKMFLYGNFYIQTIRIEKLRNRRISNGKVRRKDAHYFE